ncbi:kinesin-domain-containing protein [Phellopilus nigrolimitatus]|nr:kinesin-domain-containing protein [Phellopilus nigrolimitatus]
MRANSKTSRRLRGSGIGSSVRCRTDLRFVREDLEREQAAVASLKATVSHQSTAHITLNAQNSALEAQLTALKSTLDCKAADASQLRLDLENARTRITELEEEVVDAEMTRRRLHNTIQELKGNIRVFCRVRPLLRSEVPPEVAHSMSASTLAMVPNSGSPMAEQEEYVAKIEFPDRKDHKEIVLSSRSENAMGQERKESWNFNFDRVFEPVSSQADIFEEISQLAQSCTDGYNVCIFAYGQTGSGKSYTMEGGSNEETAGMIPRAVEQVFRVAESMKSKGWEYNLEGQFLEIYNETINDLLGKAEFDKKKHEIRHENGSTRVTDAVVVPLKSASQVRSLLSIAQSRRTTAATLMNERSSRSHSVFTLRIFGTNSQSGETCEGSLNLVDLAGSERLNSSGAGSDKDRLKETQNINKSLSALADVIAALGEKGDKADKHIPYRNSKLTFLLQNSLSGNSKTLMVLNLSPLAAHLGESLCSLRFATKVNNTTLGTAKRQARIGS